MASQIHWFPGHMNKALHEVEEKVKLVDVVIEILDARAPLSSINEQLEKIIANKKKLIVLSKPDLADPSQNEKWKRYFANQEKKRIFAPLNKLLYYAKFTSDK